MKPTKNRAPPMGIWRGQALQIQNILEPHKSVENNNNNNNLNGTGILAFNACRLCDTYIYMYLDVRFVSNIIPIQWILRYLELFAYVQFTKIEAGTHQKWMKYLKINLSRDYGCKVENMFQQICMLLYGYVQVKFIGRQTCLNAAILNF